MQINHLSYFLASILSYMGLLFGVILIKLAPEEQKLGKKYFILLKKILFIIIILPFFFFYKIGPILAIILPAFIIVLILNKKIGLERSARVYFFLGVLFYLSSKFLNLFVIESALIFLYGIPHASLMLDLKKRNYLHIFAKGLWFFASLIILYIAPSFID